MNAPVAKTALTYGVEGELALKVGTGEYEAYQYDASYRPTHVYTGTPGNQRSSNVGTIVTYDFAGRPIRERGPAASSGTGPYTTNVTYDASGNVATVLDGRNNTKTLAYGDADGLLSAVHYAYDAGLNPTTLRSSSLGAKRRAQDDDNLAAADVALSEDELRAIGEASELPQGVPRLDARPMERRASEAARGVAALGRHGL